MKRGLPKSEKLFGVVQIRRDKQVRDESEKYHERPSIEHGFGFAHSAPHVFGK
jgi:hypothetical protein